MDPTNQTPSPNPEPASPFPTEPAPQVAPQPVVEPVAPVAAAPAPEVPASPEPVTNPEPSAPASQPTVVVSSPTVAVVDASEASPPDLTSSAGPSHAAAAPADYISNPFLNSIRGLVAMLQHNPTPSLLIGLMAMVLIFGGYVVTIIGALVSGGLLVIPLSLLLMLAFLVPFGAFYVLGGSSARGETITTKEAYGKAMHKLLPFIGLSIVSTLILIVSYILLIIPGIIMTGRLLLAPMVMFEENLGPIKSIKRSMELTKGHVNEMLGAFFASTLISGGSYGLLLGPLSIAPLVGRYKDLVALHESGAPKPPVSKLNYLWMLGFVFVGIFVLLAVFADHSSFDSDTTSTSTYPYSSTSPIDSSTNNDYNFSTN